MTRRARAKRWGIEDLDRIYAIEDMAKGDCIFAATGVTDGSLLKGVKRRRGGCVTHRKHRHARQLAVPSVASSPNIAGASPDRRNRLKRGVCPPILMS